MIGMILGLIIGFATIGLGMKAFTPKGLPLTSTKTLTGTTAKLVGIGCIILGGLFLVFAALEIVLTLASNSWTRP